MPEITYTVTYKLDEGATKIKVVPMIFNEDSVVFGNENGFRITFANKDQKGELTHQEWTIEKDEINVEDTVKIGENLVKAKTPKKDSVIKKIAKTVKKVVTSKK